MKYLGFLIAYIALVPMWTGATLLLNAPHDFAFYGGILTILAIVVYAVRVTKRLILAAVTDLSSLSRQVNQ